MLAQLFASTSDCHPDLHLEQSSLLAAVAEGPGHLSLFLHGLFKTDSWLLGSCTHLPSNTFIAAYSNSRVHESRIAASPLSD